LMNNPPELHRIALKSKKRMALDLFSIDYLRKEGLRREPFGSLKALSSIEGPSRTLKP
jgi:hypothetical protein